MFLLVGVGNNPRIIPRFVRLIMGTTGRCRPKRGSQNADNRFHTHA
jgi:hypothetical protein